MDKSFAIFDMDGTLTDSMGFWRGVGGEYLESLGIPGCPENLWAVLGEMTMPEAAGELIRRFGLSGTPQAVIDGMNALMARHYARDVPLKPGVDALLAALAGRGVHMCVASATDEALVRSCLSRLGVLERFSFLLSCESLGAGKDRPDIYLEAARRFGCRPEEAAVYEDALYAARTAAGAGFYVVGVYDENAAKDWPELARLAGETLVLNR